ncbi:unnamed protein product [Coccothraustes coccothraustes]
MLPALRRCRRCFLDPGVKSPGWRGAVTGTERGAREVPGVGGTLAVAADTQQVYVSFLLITLLALDRVRASRVGALLWFQKSWMFTKLIPKQLCCFLRELCRYI